MRISLVIKIDGHCSRTGLSAPRTLQCHIVESERSAEDAHLIHAPELKRIHYNRHGVRIVGPSDCRGHPAKNRGGGAHGLYSDVSTEIEGAQRHSLKRLAKEKCGSRIDLEQIRPARDDPRRLY